MLLCVPILLLLAGIHTGRCSLLSSLRIFGRPPKEKKNVLILMSDTGGGHRASAIALEQALKEIYPNRMNVDICDIWSEHAGWPFNRFVPSYRFMAKTPILWAIMYGYGQFPPTKYFTENLSWYRCYGAFEKLIKKTNPDIVVSVHPLCQHIPLPIVKKINKTRDPSKLPIAFVTIVTDLGGAHSTWFDKRTDYCFVPSKAVYDIARNNGVSKDKIVMHGLPIRPAFWKSGGSKQKIRKTLGLADIPTTLVMGGGDGVGNLMSIATELANKLKEFPKKSQLVVVCGHNKQVAQKLTAKAWPPNVNMVVKGFMTNIDEYMSGSDCLVTKAGPGTIAEAMTRGLPMVLSSFLPGQEAGNVPYVEKGGFGIYAKNDPKRIANTVYNLFEDEVKFKSMSSKAKALSRPGATKAIAKDVGAIVLRKQRRCQHLKTLYDC